jgi:hypothetical protein
LNSPKKFSSSFHSISFHTLSFHCLSFYKTHQRSFARLSAARLSAARLSTACLSAASFSNVDLQLVFPAEAVLGRLGLLCGETSARFVPKVRRMMLHRLHRSYKPARHRRSRPGRWPKLRNSKPGIDNPGTVHNTAAYVVPTAQSPIQASCAATSLHATTPITPPPPSPSYQHHRAISKPNSSSRSSTRRHKPGRSVCVALKPSLLASKLIWIALLTSCLRLSRPGTSLQHGAPAAARRFFVGFFSGFFENRLIG